MPRPPNAQQLFHALVETPAHPLAAQITVWLEAPTFRTFAHAHETKIRRKLRLASDTESQNDLLWELEIAFRLVQQAGITLAYELGGVGLERGVDFTLTWKGHTVVGVEATRMRTNEREAQYAAAKLGDTVLAKLGQLRADTPNIIVVQTAEATWAQLDPAIALRTLVQRVEQREEVVLRRRGFENPAAFHRLFRRLSVLVLASPTAGSPKYWFNPQSHRPLPDNIRKWVVAAFER